MLHPGVSSHIGDKLKLSGLRPPQMLTLSITGACNLRCAHCWVDAGSSGSSAHVPETRLIRIIGEFAALGGRGIRLTGGETLCHPGWRNLLHTARAAGMDRIALQTNAILFTDDDMAVLSELDSPGLSIQISLDGATAASHDLVRGAGAFSAALNGIRRLSGAGFARRISLFFTEMRHNLDELPELFELADRLNIGSVSTGMLVSCGRAGEESAAAPPEPRQYLRLLERYDADPRFRDLYRKIGNVAALEWWITPLVPDECCTFVENPYLTPDGRLYPCVLCHADDYAVSGVFDKELAEVFLEGIPLWETLLEVSQSRACALTTCRQCPARSGCGGGCMGRAWGSSGDLHAVDDRCASRRAVHEKK